MKKYKYIQAVTVILSFILITAMNITIAETIEKGEIKFKRGKSSGTVSGTVLRGEVNRHDLMAGAGQWMEVKIKSPEDNAVFQVSVYSYGTGEDEQLDGARDGDDTKYWYGQLPNPGYSKDGKQNWVLIDVGGTRGNASYDLTVTIKNKRDPNKVATTSGASTIAPLSVAPEDQSDIQEDGSSAEPLLEAFVCPVPDAPCSSQAYQFEPYDLSFANLPEQLQWMTAHNSEHFYAVILKSKKAIYPQNDNDDTECGGFFSEKKRLSVQKLFPARKVFASRHACSMVWYRNVNREYNFLAVYAGQTMDEAKKVLKKVKATGKFKDANIRKMQVVVDTAH